MSENERVDKWLKAKFPSLSNAQVEEALDLGWVTASNGKRVKKGAKVSVSTDLSTAQLESQLASLKLGNPAIKLNVVYEDDSIWVVDKPVGMASHPLRLTDTETVTQWAIAQLPRLADEFEQCQPTIAPHRLDTDTSGVLIVAKSLNAYELWRDRFRKGGIQKRYLAWCWGKPPSNVFEDHSGIAHDYVQDSKMVAVTTGARYRGPILSASTIFKIVKKFPEEQLNLVEATCFTGATHQIRVHLSHLGLPLLGDSLYDPHYEKRSRPAPHHLLRATVIHSDSDKFSYGVPTEAFQGLFG